MPDDLTLPRWGILPDGGTYTQQGLSASFGHTVIAESSSSALVQNIQNVILSPPKTTKRMIVAGTWEATDYDEGFGDAIASLGMASEATVPVTHNFTFSTPANNTTNTGSFTATYTFSGGDFPYNNEAVLTTPPTSSGQGTRWRLNTAANATSGVTNRATVSITLTVTEIELDDGTIYTPTDPVDAPVDYYAIADMHDIAEASLTRLAPQPAGGFVQVTRRSHSDNGALLDEALFVEMEYSALGSVAEYDAVLTAWGVNAAAENEITLTARDHALRWKRYNGTVVQPELGKDARWDNYFPRSITLLVKEVELAS